MKRTRHIPTGAISEEDPVTRRLVVISRYVENIRRLSRFAGRVGHAEIGVELMKIARDMESMSYDIAVSTTGTVILRRAAKLIGMVENLVERQAKRGILH